MILDTTTRKLQILLAASPSTEAAVIVDYVDFTASATTPNIQLSTTSGSTPVDILNAPGASTQRKVNNLTVRNNATASITVTIRYNDNGTTYNIVTALVLGIDATLQYTDTDGWSVLGSTGGVGNDKSSWIQEFTSNGTWVKPNNCRFFLVEAVGGGGGGGGGNGGASGTARAGGGGGGGGYAARKLFLSKDLPQSVSVTVGAETSSAGSATNGSGGNQSSFGTFLIGYPGGGGSGSGTTAGSGGGGGGGGTGAGANNTGATSIAGGPAMLAGSAASSGTALGGGGGLPATSVSGSAGAGSYLGGGGGGASGSTQLGGGPGGGSFASAGGGGGGGSISAANVASNGGDGAIVGGTATATGGSTTAGLGATATTPATVGRPGVIFAGFNGGGGGGGGASNTSSGFAGGDGMFPGGGGGGGGAGLTTGGAGGTGAAGIVRVWGW